ncbi:MAG TPA: acyltransferase [Vicinamibacteria bacterium]|nr:acyltransferase [Vicinamibacteria bacterium]
MKALRLALDGAAFLRAVVSVRFWSAVAYVRLRAHGAAIGPGLRVRGPIRLHCHRSGAIRIGARCRIQSGFAGNAVGGGNRMAFWVGPEGRLTIGDDVGLSNSTIVCQREVTIGDGVFLGGDSKVYDTDFHSLDADQRALPGNPGARTAPVVIGARAFVGGHSIVLKGASIGETSIVGAGSVVRGRIPPGELWTGNPASPVRVRMASAFPARPGRGMPAEAWP